MGGQDHLSLQLVRLKLPDELLLPVDGLSFVFPQRGAGKYTSGSLVQLLGPGDVLALTPVNQGRICVAQPLEVVFWFFSASLEHLFPLFECNEICRLQGIAESFKSTKLYPASSPLAVECHRLLAEVPARFGLDHRGQLLRVVSSILTAEFKKLRVGANGHVSISEHLLQVFEKLSVAEILNLSADELASRFGCSRRHLNRLFHQHFGYSVSALRMEIRLLKATSLLREPGTKVINVAEQCGFNHLGLFNTCFKRRFNVTPGQWRKRMIGGNDPLSDAGSAETACRILKLGLCPWSGPRAMGKTEEAPTRAAQGLTVEPQPAGNTTSGNGDLPQVYQTSAERLQPSNHPQAGADGRTASIPI